MHLSKPAFAISIGLLFLALACNNQKGSAVLKADAFAAKINETPNAIVVDVRTPAEFSGGHIKSAINLDYNSPDFDGLIEKLDKTHPYFVYCSAGSRSHSAAAAMRSAGFGSVFELQGGLNSWLKAGKPLEK